MEDVNLVEIFCGNRIYWELKIRKFVKVRLGFGGVFSFQPISLLTKKNLHSTRSLSA